MAMMISLAGCLVESVTTPMGGTLVPPPGTEDPPGDPNENPNTDPDPGTDPDEDPDTDPGEDPGEEPDPTPVTQIPAATHAVVIYNNNYPPSRAIAEHYAAARRVPDDHVCGINVAMRDYISLADAEHARAQILKCFCRAYDPAMNLAGCTRSQSSVLTNLYNSNLDNIVYVKGLPRQILADPNNWELASFDDAIAKALLTNQNLVYNNFSKILAYGRIEGVSTQSSKALVDRIMKAERQGYRGNAFVGAQIDGSLGFALDYTLMKDLFPQNCYNNVNSNWTAAASLWDSANCNFAWTNNMAPSDTIPYFLDAGLYVSGNPYSTEQRPFHGSFSSALKWRKSSTTCTALCKDMGSASAIAACRASSTDYFKTLNTDCVGTSENMMGYQLRSFPVARMELAPAKWEAALANNINASDAFKNSRFADNRYVRFGAEEIVDAVHTTCAAGSGSLECLPDLGWGQGRISTTIDTSVAGSATLQKITIRFRLRNTASSPESQSCGSGKISVIAKFKDQNGNTLHELVAEDCPNGVINENRMIYAYTSVERSAWTLIEKTINLSSLTSGKTLRSIEFAIRGEKTMKGFFDIDGVEIVHTNSGTHLLAADQGSFAVEDNTDNFAEGSYHSVMIERFGAVAWWGNDGHYIDWGWGFNRSMKGLKNFFNGYPLSKALLRQEDRSITSQIYGDPLYNPISLGVLSDIDVPNATKVYISSANPAIYVRAYNGTDNIPSQDWLLERWNGSAWVEAARGEASYTKVVAISDARTVFNIKNAGQYTTLRLSLSGTGAPLKIKNVYTLEHQ